MTICFRNSILSGGAIGLAAVLITWLLVGEGSPFYDDEPVPSPLVSFWQILNIPGGFVLVAFRSLPAAIIVVFGQWFLIGFGFSMLINKRRTARR